LNTRQVIVCEQASAAARARRSNLDELAATCRVEGLPIAYQAAHQARIGDVLPLARVSDRRRANLSLDRPAQRATTVAPWTRRELPVAFLGDPGPRLATLACSDGFDGFRSLAPTARRPAQPLLTRKTKLG